MESQTYNNMAVKINSFIMDDINLDISFEFITNSLDVTKINDNISFNNMKIYDENDNLIYKSNEDAIKSGIAQTTGYSKVKEKTENTVDATFFLQSYNFPKSKKLYIEFEEVIVPLKGKVKRFSGNWKFELDVPENMINRENIFYKTTSKNDGLIEITNVKLTNTGLVIEVNAENEEVFNKSKITVIANGKEYKANNNMFTIKGSSNRIIIPFSLTKYNEPNNIIVKVQNQQGENKINLMRN